jgi:hypothetical protein
VEIVGSEVSEHKRVERVLAVQMCGHRKR